MMRLGHYFASVLFILFIGCASPEVQIPETVLTPEQMMPIMVDIHVIEGARNGAIMLGDTNGIEDYYAKVMKSMESLKTNSNPALPFTATTQRSSYLSMKKSWIR